MNDRASRIANLSPDKLKALLRKVSTEKVSQPSVAPIQKRPRSSEVLPVSFAQQRLWFLNRLDPQNFSYNLSAAMRLRGQLDVGALSAALDEIVRRHEALRTTFPLLDGVPVQNISPPAPLPLPLDDLLHLDEEEREPQATARAKAESQGTFDLSSEWPLRASLLRLNEREHWLLLTVHHIAFDAWSMGLLVRELSALYEAYAKGEPSPLPELPIQYADYAAWQREWLTGETLDAQLAYWRRQLAGAPLLELPTDRPRPPVQTYRGAQWRGTLSPELYALLKSYSEARGVTLFMLLLAAFQLLLHRYTGLERVSVGTTVAGRQRREVEGLIGFFVNTLVLCTDVTDELTFEELLGRVKETCLGAFSHQDVPFEKLVEELQPIRDLSHTPLFQVLYHHKNLHLDGTQPAGLEIGWIEIERERAQCDVTVETIETEQGIAIQIEYNSDLYEGGWVERLCGHYVRLLEAAVGSPLRRGGHAPHALRRRAAPAAPRVQPGDPAASGSRPPAARTVRPAGAADALGAGRQRRPPRAHLRRGGRAGRGARPRAAAAGRRPGDAGRRLSGAGRRVGGGAAGGAGCGERLRAARPGLPVRAAALHGGGCGGGVGGDGRGGG